MYSSTDLKSVLAITDSSLLTCPQDSIGSEGASKYYGLSHEGSVYVRVTSKGFRRPPHRCAWARGEGLPISGLNGLLRGHVYNAEFLRSLIWSSIRTQVITANAPATKIETSADVPRMVLTVQAVSAASVTTGMPGGETTKRLPAAETPQKTPVANTEMRAAIQCLASFGDTARTTGRSNKPSSTSRESCLRALRSSHGACARPTRARSATSRGLVKTRCPASGFPMAPTIRSRRDAARYRSSKHQAGRLGIY